MTPDSKDTSPLERIQGFVHHQINRLRKAPASYGEYRIAPSSVRKRIILVNWNTEEGRQMLTRSAYSRAFFCIADKYQPQLNPFYCGVACMTTTLNALRAPKNAIPNQESFSFKCPETQVQFDYPFYSQLTLLNEQTEKIKPKDEIAPSISPNKARTSINPGLSIGEVKQILELYQLSVDLRMTNNDIEDSMNHFTTDLKRTLNDPHKVMIVNFDGQRLGASTGGHFSIVGAYDEISESVLVLDAAAHKNPWYWAPVKHLCHAMNTSGQTGKRGYLLVSDHTPTRAS